MNLQQCLLTFIHHFWLFLAGSSSDLLFFWTKILMLSFIVGSLGRGSRMATDRHQFTPGRWMASNSRRGSLKKNDIWASKPFSDSKKGTYCTWCTLWSLDFELSSPLPATPPPCFSFDKYFFSTFLPDTVLWIGNMEKNKTDAAPSLKKQPNWVNKHLKNIQQ